MNKIYKSIWNEQTGTYVAVSENTKAKGKRSSSALLASAILAAVVGTAQAQEITVGDGVDNTFDGSTITITGADTSITTLNSNSLNTGTGTFSGAVQAGSLNVTSNASVGGTLGVAELTTLSGGADLANTKITGLAEGLVATGSKEAVTGGQLFTLQQQVNNSGLTVKANNGTTDKIGGSETLTFSNGTNTNTTYDPSSNTFKTNLNTSLTGLNSVSTVDLSVSNNATVVGTLGVAGLTTLSGGANLVNTKITGLADGSVATGSQEAVTGGQIFDTFFGEDAEGIKYFRVKSDKADADATGDESIAIGPAATTLADNSMAIGQGAAVTEQGLGAIALGQDAVAGGGTPVAGGAGAVAIGREAFAGGTGAVALGDDAKATAASATALGASALAGAGNTIAIGNSEAAMEGAIAAGNGAYAGSPNGIALGTGAGVGTVGNTAEDRTDHIAIGTNAGRNSSGGQNIAVGAKSGSEVNGYWNVALGVQAGSNLTGNSNISIGELANVTSTGKTEHAVSVGGYR